MKKMKKNNSGLSLLEALISMVVVGIGFVAILQVTQYSISSVNTSAERTKANFFINIFAEDSLSLRDTSKSENLNDILVVEDSTRFSSECGVQGSKMNVKTGTAGDVYRNSTSDNDPVLNKSEKWNALISNRDYMDCSNSGREKRAFEMFKICNFFTQRSIVKIPSIALCDHSCISNFSQVSSCRKFHKGAKTWKLKGD